MILLADILPLVTFLADQESTPATRWQAVYRHASSIRVNAWWAAFWLLMALVSCAAGVIIYRLVTRRLHLRRHLELAVRRLHLTSIERDVLATLARHSGLRNPVTVFAGGEAFDHAAANVVQLPRMQALPEASRQQIRALIESLRAKLGFGPDAGDPDGRIHGTRQIPLGEKLIISRADQTDLFEAVVERNSNAELILRPEAAFHARRGDRLTMQYSRGVHTWEMSALVADSMGDRLVVGHTSETRLINRRRFLRVPIRRPALMNRIPFHPGIDEPESLPLFQAELLEIAGPGLCIECPLTASLDDCVLVRIQFHDAIVQAVGRVRRAEPAGPGRFRIAIELTALNADEMADMVHRTQEAQLEETAAAAMADKAVPAVTAGWRSDNG